MTKQKLIIAGVVAILLINVGGYVWYGKNRNVTQANSQTSTANQVASTSTAEEIYASGIIDQHLESCEEANPSTRGVIECIRIAGDNYDKEIDRLLGELNGRLNSKQKQALTQSQAEWLIYKEKEFAFIEEFYTGTHGTMFIPMQAQSLVDISKDRLRKLEAYIRVVGISAFN